MDLARLVGPALVTDDASLLDATACHLELFTERSREALLDWAVPACNSFGGFEIGLGWGQAKEGGRTHELTVWQIKPVLREFSESQVGLGFALAGQRDESPGRCQYRAGGHTGEAGRAATTRWAW